MKMDEIENLFKSAKSGVKEKQVTRGHNIVANGWTGAHNPLSHTDNGRADEQSLS